MLYNLAVKAFIVNTKKKNYLNKTTLIYEMNT